MANTVLALGPGPGTGTRVKVASGPLRMRKTPGLSGQVLASMSTGATGELTNQMPATLDGYVWVHVNFGNGTIGWVARNFLQFL